MHLQEIIFASSDSKISKQISKLEKAKKIRKIAPRLYSPNFEDKKEIIIKRNLFHIISQLFPGAMLSHRSALEFQPTREGHIFLTYKYTKKISIPGITLRFLQGKPIVGDNPFFEKMLVSQRERAFLENLQHSKRKGSISKTLTKEELEAKLEKIIRIHGEDAINKLRERAKVISLKLKMKKEFEQLNKIISALLASKPSTMLISPIAIARAFGFPYDPDRLVLFERLFVELQKMEFIDRKDKNISTKSFQNFAFFESYFSNYIEGTIFELEEAKRIIDTNKPLFSRNDDSHDVLGTYKIVSSKKEMHIVPSNADEFLKILSYRHKILLSSRISVHPGEFKDKNNRAGSTEFVDYNLVRGTLIKSFEYYKTLQHPFAKAAYMMFVLSEVHPFTDGNGRIARVMMNAELCHKEQSKIIIPTVYRDDYLGTLRKLTKQGDPASYLRMLQRAHEFSASVHGNNYHEVYLHLKKSNAFLEHTEGKLKIINL
jgi:hypothetical protein